jgi:signal transduction histidine kinase
MNLFSGRVKEISIISIILIVIISYGLFFYLQNITEHSIRNSLFEQQKERQIQTTKAISQHIGSDLRLVMSILQGLADSAYLQQGALSGDKTIKLMQEKYTQANTLTTVDGLFIADKDDIITSNIVSKGQKSFINIDISFRDYVKEIRRTLTPTFSNGFEGIDGKYRIAMTYPIINRETGEYVGLVGAEIPTISFFEYYGNVHDINSQFFVVFDRKATMVAVGASKDLVGKNFFEEHTQNFINHNPTLNSLTRSLLAGKSDYGVYDYGRGERLTTESPIFVNDKPIYFIQLVTPTKEIYSQIDNTLFTQRIETFTLLAGTTAAIVALIIFLIKWSNTLQSEVKRRTKELDESNKQFALTNKKLESANEQLKVHDSMQKEFINIAAHELRTPIQPIVSLTEVLRSKIEDTQQVDLLSIITRNAKRLQRLTEDILDVSRIESHSLKLNKERFNLDDLISSVIDDYRNRIEKDNIAVKLLYEPNNKDNNIFVEADRGRLIQVISNLLDNAIKFTKEGTISIITEEKDSKVVVSVNDTGTGINPEILPRLFSKFASKSERVGTGLGLFICKNIVEAHGGKIWIESDDVYKEKGATFSFSLPIMKQQPINVEQIDK